jgi:hypothetical protein
MAPTNTARPDKKSKSNVNSAGWEFSCIFMDSLSSEAIQFGPENTKTNGRPFENRK